MINRLEQDLKFNREALNLRSYRQELLASNIANADTPHFKARDIDFKSALAGAIGGRTAPAVDSVELERTHTAHIAGKTESEYSSLAKYRSEYMGAVDGNTVNMDIERSALAENSLQMEALLTFINKRFEGMQRAINGQ